MAGAWGAASAHKYEFGDNSGGFLRIPAADGEARTEAEQRNDDQRVADGTENGADAHCELRENGGERPKLQLFEANPPNHD